MSVRCAYASLGVMVPFWKYLWYLCFISLGNFFVSCESAFGGPGLLSMSPPLVKRNMRLGVSLDVILSVFMCWPYDFFLGCRFGGFDVFAQDEGEGWKKCCVFRPMGLLQVWRGVEVLIYHLVVVWIGSV